MAERANPAQSISHLVASLPPTIVLILATPGYTLDRHDDCHVHSAHRSVMNVKGHEPETYAAMDAIFDWHNLRTLGPHYPDEGYFRCLAIYGAAAHRLIEEAERA